MQNVTASETLASVEQVQRRARDAAWSSGWLLMTAGGLGLAVFGLLRLTNDSWPWALLYVGVVLPLMVVGARQRTRNRARLGLGETAHSRWPFKAATVPMFVGTLLILLTRPARVEHQLQMLLLPEPLALVGTALLVAVFTWVAIRERSAAMGAGAAVWTLAAAVAWIEAQASYPALMIISLGLEVALTGLIFWRRQAGTLLG